MKLHVQQMDILLGKFSVVADPNDVGVIELGERLGLVAFASRHFQRDQTVHGKLPSQVDMRESALTQLLQQQKIVDLGSESKFWWRC